MHHVTISTTGVFNVIRPSLFPPIEGKETTTFLLGLDFNTGEIIPFYDEEQDDVVVNGPHVELERQWIRTFVKAVCKEMGKPFEATQPTLTEWLTNYTPKFSTIDEYKKALVSWMSYVFH